MQSASVPACIWLHAGEERKRLEVDGREEVGRTTAVPSPNSKRDPSIKANCQAGRSGADL